MVDREASKVRRRRRSYDPDGGAAKSNFEKGIQYGNMAHLFDMIRAEMAELQAEVLMYFRDLIKCEEVFILFADERTQQLMLQFNNIWYRTALDSGNAGQCYKTGDVISIPDVYQDHYFNRYLSCVYSTVCCLFMCASLYSRFDDKLGIRTRNTLCQPVRGNRGAGNIVAVVQMINKFHGTVQEGGVAKPNYVPFDSHDEETLALCVQRVADDLGKLVFVCICECGSVGHHTCVCYRGSVCRAVAGGGPVLRVGHPHPQRELQREGARGR